MAQIQFAQIGNMLIGNDQNVRRSLWIDIPKGGDLLILIQDCSWNFPLDYLAEKAVSVDVN